MQSGSKDGRGRVAAAILLLIVGSFFPGWFALAGKPGFSRVPVLHVGFDPPRSEVELWHDTARALAGLPLSPRSPLYRATQVAAGRRHASAMGNLWRQIRRNVDTIARWQKENIPARFTRNPVLYPLSGTDLVNAYAFFPRSPEYLLLSLESPGYIPRLTSLGEQELEDGLTAIRRTLDTLATVNYLKSRVMGQELANQVMPGTLPVLLAIIAGLGHRVEDVQAIRIDERGNLVSDVGVERMPSDLSGAALCGVRIEFRDAHDGTIRSLLYLQMRLRNDAVRSTTAEGRFLLRITARNTILKAAVYLMHSDSYDEVRQYLLARSELVLQDDSGIPYGAFRDGAWEHRLFGGYEAATPVIGVPCPRHQPELAARYRSLGASPLPFAYGYGVWRENSGSNLMLFTRRMTRPEGLRTADSGVLGLQSEESSRERRFPSE